jgi:hypothetical protein
VLARGGAEVALGLCYKIFLIYRTCMRHAPARPARACFVRTCCVVVVQEHDCTRPRRNAKPSEHFRQTSHSTLHALHPSRRIRHVLHFTLHHKSSHLSSAYLCGGDLVSALSSHVISFLFICRLKKFSSTTTTSDYFSPHPISS